MGVYEYRGGPGLGYLKLPCAHGTAPFTDLKPGDLVDFGDNEPPADSRWAPAAEGAEATRIPDNHPDAQAAVQWPEPEPEEPAAEDAVPADPAPTDLAPADTAKPRKPAAKTTA